MSDEHEAGVEATLGTREIAVLAVLVEQGGRVVDRDRLRHDAGLEDLCARSCESALVGVRRVLGHHAIVTVRRRGWRLSVDAIPAAMALVASLG